MTNNFTEFSGAAGDLVSVLLKSGTGISYVSGSASYSGTKSAASTFDSLSLGGAVISGPGILLTSGDGTPPPSNTLTSYSVQNFQPGDSNLDAIVNNAFPAAGSTEDASVLSFKINASAGTKTVIFDIVFGSDEFPEWSNTEFVDIAAVIVNGKNAAFFGGDSKKPLSILDKNLGYFQNNQDGHVSIEYDGISNKLTVIAKVKEGVNDIKIAIADTGDQIYDSGIFIANLRGSEKDLEGILNEVSGTTGNDKLKAIAGIDNVVIGDLGKDKLYANNGFDILYGDQEDDGGSDVSAVASSAVALSLDFKDTFFFKKTKYLDKKISKTDVIADWDSKDKINLSKLAGPKLDFIGKAKFSDNGDGEVRYKQFKKKDFTAVYVDTNGDGKTDASVKVLGLHKFNDGDFSL
ncbi:MAG: choice-of-anchor L domain-containing protein [Bauldia sp.]|nr:choice-of-anchor L domain-containing protein [Bauldia sp.]